MNRWQNLCDCFNNNDFLHTSLTLAQDLCEHETILTKLLMASPNMRCRPGVWTGAIWFTLILKKNKESPAFWRK